MSSSDGPALHVVVVGGGECGARVVHELAEGGWPGTITLVGAEDRPPYERPPLSKATLVDAEPHPVEPYREGGLARPGVTVLTGRHAVALDIGARQVALDDGASLPYDRLVLATGASPRRLPDTPQDVLTLRTWDDALALRAALEGAGHLLVVGGGLIGLEVAASARTKGVEVTVVEASPHAPGRAVPEPVAQVLADRHRAEGVDLRLATTLIALDRSTAGGWTAQLSDGTTVTADVVLQAVGSTPETALAAAAGIAVDDGIVVDTEMRTSAPDVWAAGDCCRGPLAMVGGATRRVESWRMAHDQAVTAAASILGHAPSHAAVPWFWSDQYDLSVQVYGIADAATTWVSRPLADGTCVHLGLDDDGRLVCAAGAGRAAVAKEARQAERLIGAGARPDPVGLADPALPLRSLLTH